MSDHSPSSPPFPYATPLDDVIGNTQHLQCEESVLTVKGLNVKCWKYTSPKASTPKPEIIGIHGGPAFTHRYILPLKLLADHGYPVIFYDQAGCGGSSRLEDAEHEAPWLFTVEYYLDELSAIVDFYQLKEYYLYGSSWGTVIAQEYAVRQPVGLYGVILDGALSDPHLYIATQKRDRHSTLPSYTQHLLSKIVSERNFAHPAYPILDDTLTKFFVCRQIPPPDAFYECLMGVDKTIYAKMQGECEFMIGGVLADWNINDRLHLIQVPTVVLAGEYDTMTEMCSLAIVNRIPTAWPLVTIPRAGHCKLLDEPQLCVEVMAKFLHTVETTRKLLPKP